MAKPFRFLLVLAVVALGCASDSAKLLAPAEFMKVTGAVGAQTLGTNETAEAELKPRLITPGMVISIMVDQDQSLNRQVVVPPSGAIEYPPLGRVVVEGLTTEEVAQGIKQVLERDYFQTATVQCAIETAAATGGGGAVVYIIGNIGRPGPLLLPPNEQFTVTKAIIAAGGIGQFGNGAAVQLIRYGPDGKKYKTTVNVDRIMKYGEFEKDVPLQNGDWIIVAEKWINF